MSENESYRGVANATERVLCQLNFNKHNVALIVVYTLIFCLSVIGNCLVIVTIVQQRWMRTVTNFYLLNLAISDLLLSVICMPPSLISKLVQCFLFGEFVCKALRYLQPVSVTASAYTLAVIALERYFAICRPLHSRHWQTRSHAGKMICIVWAISFVSNISALIINRLEELNDGRFNCRYAFGLTSEFLLGHQVVLTIALFVLPLGLMVILYGLVIRTLWLGIQLEMQGSEHTNGQIAGSQEGLERSSGRRKRYVLDMIRKNVRRPLRQRFSSGHASNNPTILVQGGSPQHGRGEAASRCRTDSSASRRPSGAPAEMALRSTHMEKSLLAKKRVIKMLLAVVVIFFLCWTPLYTYFLIFSISKVKGFFFWHNDAFTVFGVVAYLSSVTNPITYCFLNKKFRQAFLLAFGCRRMAKEECIRTAFTSATYNKAQAVNSGSSANRAQKERKKPVKLSVVEEKSPAMKPVAMRKVESEHQLNDKTQDNPEEAALISQENVSLYDNVNDNTSPVKIIATRLKRRAPIAENDETNF